MLLGWKREVSMVFRQAFSRPGQGSDRGKRKRRLQRAGLGRGNPIDVDELASDQLVCICQRGHFSALSRS